MDPAGAGCTFPACQPHVGEIIYKGLRYRHGAFTGINEVVVDKARPMDENYYNLMGQPVGKDVPSTPGIYIHHGKKIAVH